MVPADPDGEARVDALFFTMHLGRVSDLLDGHDLPVIAQAAAIKL
jgi:hypothetical protein